MRIDGLPPPPRATSAARRPSASAFGALLPEGQGPEYGPTAETPEAAATAPAAVIAEATATPPPPRPDDALARRHGRAMLDALGALHLARLRADPGAPSALGTLATLTQAMPAAEDPVLRLVLREIALRATVELARPTAA